MTDLRDRLRDDMDRQQSGYPETWDPRQEDTADLLVGELTDVRTDVPTRHGPADVAEIADEETGEIRSVWLSHHVLDDQWRQAAPEIGDRVGIAYLGLVQRDEAHDYHSFSVRVDRDEEDREPQPAGDGAATQPHPSGDDRFPDDELPV